MKNKSTHTLTPWEIEFECRDTFGRQGFSIGHRGKGTIFEMVYTGGYAADSPREYAEFIIRAVNSHDVKEWALEAIKARINGVWDNPALKKFGPLGNCTDDILRIITQAEEK